MESREMRRMVSRELNWIEIQLGCFRIVKNISLYRAFDCNRSIEMIDSYDETVHCGPFRICRIHRIIDGWSRCSV